MTGVAVMVTDVPAQTILEGDAAILTPASKTGLTVIVMPAEVAGLPDVQVSLEVSTQLIISPLAGAYA